MDRFDPAIVTVLTAALVESERRRKEIASERKQMEEILQRYRLLSQNSRDIILFMDRDGRILEANNAAGRAYGYTRRELLSMNIRNLRVPETAPLLEKHMEQSEGKGILFETIHARKDGTTIPIEVSSRSTTINGKVYIINIIRDITERKMAEETLRTANRQLRDIIEFLPDPTFVIDRNGKVVAWNREIENMTGVFKRDIVGKGDHAYAVPFYGKPQPLIIDLVLSRDEIKTPAYKRYNYIDQKDLVFFAEIFVPTVYGGRGAHLWIKASPLFDGDGNKTGAIESIRDISDQRKMEEEIRRSTKLESISILAGGIAHDFNNILTAITGNVSLAKSRAGNDVTLFKTLAEVEKASFRAKALTQQLLTFSDGGAPVKKVLYISGLIRETVEFVLRGTNVKCDYLMPGDLWPLEIDEGQVSQVLHNIVINARQAMPGGGRIKIYCRNISTGTGPPLPLPKDNYVQISISDQGFGIPREHIQKIFDPYFTTKPGGSGLGLATSHSIIAKHGGHISVESELCSGTTFHIFLPASPGRVPASNSKKMDRPGHGRVLVMDDDEMVRNMAARLLEHFGYQADTAGSGEEAIKKYSMAKKKAQPFDVVITDLTVPDGMGGLEALYKLLKIDPGARVIVSSGYSNDPVMSNYRKLGFCGVLTKPYKAEDLVSTLNKVLRGR